MTALKAAYDLLTIYAGSFGLDGESVQQAACRFDQQTAAERLLIAIRGQETPVVNQSKAA